MDEKQPTTPLKKPRRRWFRRLLWTVGVLFVLVAAFHRWIFFQAVGMAVKAAEKAGHLQIAYQLEGTIFTSLELSKVKVRVIEPGSLEKLTLDKLSLHYHPWDGLTKGLPALVESVEIRDLDLILNPTKAPHPPKIRQRRSSSSAGFAMPFPRLVDLRGIRIRVQTPGGLLDVDNANLTLLPDQAGVLSVDHLIIPNYRTFDHLHGETSYRDKDLILQNLAIEKNLVVQKLQVDASRLGEQQLTANLTAQTFGGNLLADLSLTNLGQTNDLTITTAASKIDFAQLAQFINPAATTSGILEKLNLRIDGEADDLTTWNGGLALQITQPVLGKLTFDTGNAAVKIHNGQLQFTDTALLKGEQWITLGGTAQLPGRDPKTHPFLADIILSANIPHFASLIPDSSGSASLNATVKASPAQIDARLDSNITAFGLKNITLDSAQATASFSKSITPNQPWWVNSRITTNILASTLKINDYAIDRVAANVSSTNEKANIESVEIVRGKNSLRTHGTFVFQEKPTGPLPGILDLVLKIDGPSLQEFSVDPENPIISGIAQGSGSFHWETAQPQGKLNLQGSDLFHQGVKLGTLAIDADADNGTARLTNLQLDLPGNSFIQATGTFDLLTQDRYAAQVSTRLTDLSQFKPLLGIGLANTPLAGTLELNWNGTGELSKHLHEGRLSLFAKDGVYAAVNGIQLLADGYYTPTQAEFPTINLSTSKGNLSTAVAYFNKVLKITNLQLTQNKELRLAGNVAFPLDLENIANSEKRFPLDAPIDINLTGKEVQLGGLSIDLGITPPATGKLTLDIQSKGTLRNLDALISLKAQDIKTEKAKQIQPIAAEVNIAIANQRANLSGNIREPSLQPIALSGSVPLDLASIISTGSINPKLPIQAKASLPPTQLTFVTRYVSALRQIDGTLGFDVSMEGTLDKPVFLGGVKANLQTIRFRSDSLPTIRGVALDLGFRENVLKLNQCKGDIAGGPFTASGSINLTKPAEPVFDLKLQGRSILLVRNDSLIVRSDLDLAVKGPLASAEVSGNVGITDSRFFREIDILPFNLPGRPAPAIAGKRPNLSFPDPPLRDWKFNIAIKTLDSFRITGNLANGEVIVGLNFAGTGLSPTLDGNVQIYRLVASLPFSRFYIDAGNIYFSKDLPPLDPILDLRGKSKVRDYDIDAYIWGDATKPQTLFLSQPPLSQEDILTLLATGVTQSEIAENPQLLAGRAGWLIIQKYYNKIFRRQQSFEQDSLADRVDVQIGNVDPKTGRESASARLRLSDRWQIIGDLDLTGGVRGQVRYLLRFK